MQKDALQEVANIGAAHAATALSQMVNREITMGIPSIRIIPLEQTIECVQNEPIAVGIFLRLSNELPSYVLMVLSEQSAKDLTSVLTGEADDGTGTLSEMDQSALMEIGNIMMCAFFDSLTELLGVSLIPGPPALAYDMPTAILDFILIQIGQISNDVVLFDTSVQDQQHDFHITMFLIPEPKTVQLLLAKLGVNETP